MSKWDQFDDVAKEHGQSMSKDGWFRPDIGESKVRILSEFEVIGKHWIESLRRSFICYGKDKGCPYDTVIKDKKTGEQKTVHRPGIKYLTWVIDRKDNKIKIGELPYSVAKFVADLRKSEEYKFDDVPSYDIIITKTKTGTASTDVEYTVVPSRKDTPLTEAEKTEFSEKNNLAEIVSRMKEKELMKNETKDVPEEDEGD